MATYLVQRLASVVPVLLLVTAAVFTLVHLTPGDAAVVIAGESADPETIARLRREAFVGTASYDLSQLRADLDRFTFLLGGNDGESLFQPEPR